MAFLLRVKKLKDWHPDSMPALALQHIIPGVQLKVVEAKPHILPLGGQVELDPHLVVVHLDVLDVEEFKVDLDPPRCTFNYWGW